MPVFLVSLDLTKNDAHDYQPLWRRLREWRAKQVLYSDWFIAGNTTCRAIYDDLARFIHPSDRLLVLGLTGEGVWGSNRLMISDDEAKRMFVR